MKNYRFKTAPENDKGMFPIETENGHWNLAYAQNAAVAKFFAASPEMFRMLETILAQTDNETWKTEISDVLDSARSDSIS